MKLCDHSRAMVCHLSPPARGRGLKHLKSETFFCLPVSPPARGRGLKLPTP